MDKMRAFAHVYTMAVVIIAWVIFRSKNIVAAFRYIGNMFGIGAKGLCDRVFFEYLKGTYFIIIIAIIGSFPILKAICVWLERKKLAWIEDAWLLIVFVLSIIQIISSTYNPFIYFNF